MPQNTSGPTLNGQPLPAPDNGMQLAHLALLASVDPESFASMAARLGVVPQFVPPAQGNVGGQIKPQQAQSQAPNFGRSLGQLIGG